MMLECRLEALMSSRWKPVVDLGLLRRVEVAVWSDSVFSVFYLLLLVLVVAIIIIFLFNLLLNFILILYTMTCLILADLIRILHHLAFIVSPFNQYLFDIALYL